MHDPKGKTHVTQETIAQGLRDLGLKRRDLVQVHSSLSSLGHVEGGADTVIRALLEVVGPTGTIMVPTFNHGQVEIFDVKTTPSVNGAITEAVRKRPEAKRSIHPTHPYAAIGPLAAWLTCEHIDLLTFDRHSPLGKLAEMGGLVLLLGVGMNVNTAAHVGETIAQVPCMGYRENPGKILMPDGTIEEAWSVLWRDGPCLLEWEPLETEMRGRGMVRDGQIGDAKVMLMRGADVIRASLRLTETLCPKCSTRPKRTT